MNDTANKIASGETVDGVRLLWCDQDPNNPGAYLRFADGTADEPLEFAQWSDGDATKNIHYGNWFRPGADPCYLGPDEDGLYPMFS